MPNLSKRVLVPDRFTIHGQVSFTSVPCFPVVSKLTTWSLPSTASQIHVRLPSEAESNASDSSPLEFPIPPILSLPNKSQPSLKESIVAPTLPLRISRTSSNASAERPSNYARSTLSSISSLSRQQALDMTPTGPLPPLPLLPPGLSPASRRTSDASHLTSDSQGANSSLRSYPSGRRRRPSAPWLTGSDTTSMSLIPGRTHFSSLTAPFTLSLTIPLLSQSPLLPNSNSFLRLLRLAILHPSLPTRIRVIHPSRAGLGLRLPARSCYRVRITTSRKRRPSSQSTPVVWGIRLRSS